MIEGYEQLPKSGPEHKATTLDKLSVMDATGDTEVWSIMHVRKKSLVICKPNGRPAEIRTTLWTGWPVMWSGRQVQLLRPIGEQSVAAPPKARPPRATGETKIAKCRALYAANSTLSREEITALFVSEAGCTPAGAVTYFLTCQKG